MKSQAIAKINAEMQKDPDNQYIEILGHYIIDRCTDDITAAKVAAEGKTLTGAMDKIMRKARAVKKGNVGVLSHSVVFGTVDEYFGLKTDEQAQINAMTSAMGTPKPQKPGVALDLADFL